GEYAAQNFTSGLKHVVESFGMDGQPIEDSREQILKDGRALDAKIKKEVQQFNEMGGWSNAGEYVAQNATSLGVKGAKALGADWLAKNIEKKRSDVLNVGRDVDNVIALAKQDIKDCLAEQRGEIHSSPVARAHEMRLQKKAEARQEEQTHVVCTPSEVEKLVWGDKKGVEAVAEFIINSSKDNSR
ncbi:MAG: hypothetical protein J6C85_02215, partial [Alphaproteobacteria bacterium]|nr:hypothetical protein [Alphaproteobacteria bacterium]